MRARTRRSNNSQFALEQDALVEFSGQPERLLWAVSEREIIVFGHGFLLL